MTVKVTQTARIEGFVVGIAHKPGKEHASSSATGILPVLGGKVEYRVARVLRNTGSSASTHRLSRYRHWQDASVTR